MPPELRFSASSAERRPPATRTSNATVGRIGLEIRRDSAERHQYQSQRPQCCWAWASWDWGWQGGGVLGSLAPRLEELDRISGVPREASGAHATAGDQSDPLSRRPRAARPLAACLRVVAVTIRPPEIESGAGSHHGVPTTRCQKSVGSVRLNSQSPLFHIL